MAEFSTRISEVGPGTVNLRGYSLADVMRELSYTEGAFLTMVGRLPSAAEARLVDSMLNSLLDHGWVASTITAARYVASGNPQFIPAVAGGVLAAGSNTLSPEHSFQMLERAAQLRERENVDANGAAAQVVAEIRAAGRRVPAIAVPTYCSISPTSSASAVPRQSRSGPSSASSSLVPASRYRSISTVRWLRSRWTSGSRTCRQPRSRSSRSYRDSWPT